MTRLLTLILIVFSCFVYTQFSPATCHDDASCEDVEDRLVTRLTWQEAYSNRADYYINDTDPQGMPSLTGDVNAAANQWDLIQFEGETIQFNLRYLGDTFLHPADNEQADNVNVVGWKGLGTGEDAVLAQTYRWWYEYDPSRMKEADIGFNYYKPLNRHSGCTSTEYCIRDAATHEWGHFAGLEHVQYRANQQSGIGNCPHWVDYTMHTTRGANTHERETLECEDKWALDYKY